jgi:hypothetical protein
MNERYAIVALLLGSTLSGCTWDEGLTIENMTGTVVLPEAAATRTFVDDNGNPYDVTDARLIGPVYLGVYSEVIDGIEPYPYPAVGPQFIAGVAGDTYPYGGTTIGDLRFACVQDLTCKLASGRYGTFDDIVDWFRDTLKEPIVDQFGNDIPSGDYLRQVCYDLLEVDTDTDVRITPWQDVNGDGTIDGGDVDFTQRNDGQFEAEFTLWQQEYFDNSALVEKNKGKDADVHGFSLWGFMDAPGIKDNQFSTCNPDAGYVNAIYNNFFDGGVAYNDVLNQPAFYISDGDWVSAGFQYDNWYDTPELAIDIPFTPVGQ